MEWIMKAKMRTIRWVVNKNKVNVSFGRIKYKDMSSFPLSIIKMLQILLKRDYSGLFRNSVIGGCIIFGKKAIMRLTFGIKKKNLKTIFWVETHSKAN